MGNFFQVSIRTILRSYGLPALIACLGCISVLVAIDPAGDYPSAPEGPGLTLDEVFNIEQGVRLVAGLRAYALGACSLVEVFGDSETLGTNAPLGYHLPDHPPLGRLAIGIFHDLSKTIAPPAQPSRLFVIACARTAAAVAFGALIFLVGTMTGKWYGPAAGGCAAVSLILMPRLFGHAHLASLETFIGLTYTAAALAVAHTWSPPRCPSWKTAGLTGLLWGLALLTKIQAILLPIPIALWALAHHRGRAVFPLLIWGCVGLAVFFAGWPWLWLDPVNHFWEYFGRTTDRIALYTWYGGERYLDRTVPWHYPAILFLTTVPVGLHWLAACGVFSKPPFSRQSAREQVLLACLAFPLVLFMLPGIAVYDGVRLFLVVFPLWAVFIGRGSLVAFQWLRQRVSHGTAVFVLCGFLIGQGYGSVAMAPCHLSYYNLLTGGLRGAERWGLEPTYWGDSLSRSFLRAVSEQVPPGAIVHVSPVLHQFQLEALRRHSLVVKQSGIPIEPFDPHRALESPYLVLFRRKADLPEILHHLPADARLLAEVRREGVQLAALYKLPDWFLNPSHRAKTEPQP